MNPASSSKSSPTNKLPLGVLLPIRNVRAHLPRHLEAAREWIPLVEEIVVVDSESTDGSVAYLQSQLQDAPVRYFNRPPGLYAAWNFGLRQLQSSWTYISTMGDVISTQGLTSLVQTARRHEADVVISPPSFVDPDGHPLTRKWPVHEFLQSHPLSTPAILQPLHAFLWSALFIPGSILGSSASNLYRTRTLQSHPFPETYRHAGDTAWAIQNLPAARTVLVPESFATFMVHESASPSRSGEYNPNRRKLLQLAEQTWQDHLPSFDEALVAPIQPLVTSFWNLLRDLFETNQSYLQSRHAAWPWILSPKAWRLRSRKENLSQQVRRLRAQILQASESNTRQVSNPPTPQSFPGQGRQ